MDNKCIYESHLDVAHTQTDCKCGHCRLICTNPILNEGIQGGYALAGEGICDTCQYKQVKE